MQSLRQRRFIILLLALAGACLASHADSTENKEPTRPNFLVIMADDISPNMFGAYGNTEVETPNLDELAETGVKFETAWAIPMCSPTRTLLVTGRYADKTGMWHNDFRIQYGDHPPLEFTREHLTFARVLRENGYATAIAGNTMAIGGEAGSEGVGFDEQFYFCRDYNLPNGQIFNGPSEGVYKASGEEAPSRFWHPCILHNGVLQETGPDDFGPDLFVDFLIDFMSRNKEGPFLAYFPMALPHVTAGGKLPTSPAEGVPGVNEGGTLNDLTEYVDIMIGRLVAALDELGIRDNTIIFFTADNGTQRAGKTWAMEEGPHVPMIINSPGLVETRGSTREMMELTDIFPTLLDFSGAQLPEDYEIDGKSLEPFLSGEADSHREFVFSYIATARMIRSREWLLEAIDPVYATAEGRLFYCGDATTRYGYTEMTLSTSKDAQTARAELMAQLETLPQLDYASTQVQAAIEYYNTKPYKHHLPGTYQVIRRFENYTKEPQQ